MNTVKIPDGYPQLMPYIIVRNAASFIDFTQKVFDAKEKLKAMRDEETIMHAEISIGSSVIMIADATDAYKEQPAGMFLYVDDCDAVYKRAITYGAEPLSAPADQSYGRSAGIRDTFGNSWWIISL